MIEVTRALKIIGRFHPKVGVENAGLFESLGRVLAENIQSKIEMPPFNKSAMDGYAVSKSDRSEKFHIKGTLPAGKVSDIKVKMGECVKIMTGAMLPEGTDCVVKKEITLEKNGIRLLEKKAESPARSSGVRYKGPAARLRKGVTHKNASQGKRGTDKTHGAAARRLPTGGGPAMAGQVE